MVRVRLVQQPTLLVRRLPSHEREVFQLRNEQTRHLHPSINETKPLVSIPSLNVSINFSIIIILYFVKMNAKMDKPINATKLPSNPTMRHHIIQNVFVVNVCGTNP